MLVIRLRRIGRKHDPHYRVVVAEHTAPVQGKFIAEIGHYHPKTKETVINKDQLNDWIAKGAKPSNTVAKICQRTGIKNDKLVVKHYHGQPKKKAQEAVTAQAESASKPTDTETPAVDAPTDEATPTEETSEAESQESEPTVDATSDTPSEE